MSEEQKPSRRRGRKLRDQQLLAGMKDDFDAGFGKVVEEYWRELYKWDYKLLAGSGLTHLAEDAVQEGLFSAYKDLRHNRQKLCNLYLQHWLYAWENEGEDIAAVRSADITHDPAYRLERWESICEAHSIVTELLKSLSGTQREVVVLKYLSQNGAETAEITYQQIAKRLNKPAGTVRSDISRAMQRMRKRFSEQRGKEEMRHKSELSMV